MNEDEFNKQWRELVKNFMKVWHPRYAPIADQIPCPDKELRMLLAMSGGEKYLENLDMPVEKYGGKKLRDVLQTEEGIRNNKIVLMRTPEVYWDVIIKLMIEDLRKSKK